MKLSLDEQGRLTLTGPDGSPLDPRVERRARREKEPELRAWLDERCHEINAAAEEIFAPHLLTPPPDLDHRYYAASFDTAAPAPPDPMRFSILDYLLPSWRKRRVAEHERAETQFGTDLHQWVAAGEAHKAEQERLRRRFEELRLTDEPTMEELLRDAITALHWPRETLVSFDLANGGRALYLDIDLPEIEDMPRRSAEAAARGLKLNMKERSETQVRKMYATHVHGVVFRAVGESFATLPSLEELFCSGFSQRVDPGTGGERDDYLLSVRVTRGDWRRIDFGNLARLDPAMGLAAFELREDMTKSAVFSPIEPFGPS